MISQDQPATQQSTKVNGVHSPTTDPKDEIVKLLANDHKVKVAGIDCDGVLRGKIMSKDKFLSSLKGGFGMSSAIFGWDMHDVTYTTDASIASAENGYKDFTARIDIASFRRLPFEDDLAFFLVSFEMDGTPVCADGRGMLSATTETLAQNDLRGLAGVELEFFNFQTPSEDGYASTTARPNLAAFLTKNKPSALRGLTGGMFGYSVSRPVLSKNYFHNIYDQGLAMGCPLEAFHTESGPGVYEAALAVCPMARMADNVALFKLLTKSLGVEHGVTPCFMAKPVFGLPGNSGHIHVSLTDLHGNNAFARDTPDDSAPWSDLTDISDTGRHFLAGLLDALPYLMPLLAPNINSYKRLVENYWAPITLSWGLEDRFASIRLVAPPTCKPAATRFEVRIPGADLHPHYALAAIFGAGLRGIKRRMEVGIPPASKLSKDQKPARLPNTLDRALERFEAKDSVAREILGDEFVDFFAASRHHELGVWREAVTDWEFTRYIELV